MLNYWLLRMKNQVMQHYFDNDKYLPYLLWYFVSQYGKIFLLYF